MSRAPHHRRQQRIRLAPRTAIQHRFHEAVEQLARKAEAEAAHQEAVKWWRRRAADDPLNASVAVAMMNALARAGDRNGALREARLFEALIAEELSLSADAAVVELAASLRAGAGAVADAGAGRVLCIAVQPFVTIGLADAREAVAWAEGLVEEIMHALAGESSVRVAARSPALSPGVTHVLEGSLRFTSEQVRVTARLVEVAGGYTVWPGRLDCAHGDMHTAEMYSRSYVIHRRFTSRGVQG